MNLPQLPVAKGEEFRHIANHPGYCISDHGTLMTCWRPFGRGLQTEWRILSGGVDKDGYRKAILCTNGKRHYVRRSSLVLTAFVGERPKGMVVCHSNGNRSDDRVSNLRWDTQRANMQDKRLCGTYQEGDKSPRPKLSAAQVKAMRESYAGGESLHEIAARHGVTYQCIYAAVKGNNWKCVR